MRLVYDIRHTAGAILVESGMDGAAWKDVPVLGIDNFWPIPHGFCPRAQLALQWDSSALYGLFSVRDRYVLARQTAFNNPVCTDSCVEYFVQPSGGRGYCNFEFNAAGVKLISHVRNPVRDRGNGGFLDWVPWTEEDGSRVEAKSSLQGPIPVEREGDCMWSLAFRIPFDTLLSYTGGDIPVCGTRWRANAYKCADATSHPHWGSWSQVRTLNFHNPNYFGEMRFV